MTISRDRLNQYQAGLNKLVELAQADIKAVYEAFEPLGDAELMRDAMTDAVAAAATKYGDMSAALAAELFEELSDVEVGRAFDTLLSDTYDPAQLEKSVRYSARHLFGGEWTVFLNYLNGVIDKAVKQPARDTMMDNAARHAGSGVRFARIPKGPTCPFCTMLASRGFVYRSEKLAGEMQKFHPKCDCQIVPSWEKSPRVDGYDPDGMYARYSQCRKTCGSGSAEDILAEMATRDRRWLYDGTEPPVTFIDRGLEREVVSKRSHELRTANRLSRLGVNCDFAHDSIEYFDSETGELRRAGLADFASGYEIKTLMGTCSKNTINGYLKNTSKKKNAVAVVFDNVENDGVSDDALVKMLGGLRSFSRGRVYVLAKDGNLTRIR